MSRETAAATRAPLEALTRMMVKPEGSSDGTLEGLVREMLRPMLREWIDANLPDMVEDMVAREIAKIMNQQPDRAGRSVSRCGLYRDPADLRRSDDARRVLVQTTVMSRRAEP
ncbi:DUF2497 domain-containing protein [Sphingomonas sp. Ant20]|uniref:DUF2497 domain-containing protein n=1 Tax=Sphingomonas sp. Ant20 TaxID=104605 RepID=UPI000A6C3140|nr:DUF2497 domain-containing protein [Sphingomonas sp. Ant20]